LDFFPPNLSTVSDEHGEGLQEGLHQDISTMEKRFTGRSSQNMLADCCLNLTEEVFIANYK